MSKGASLSIFGDPSPAAEVVKVVRPSVDPRKPDRARWFQPPAVERVKQPWEDSPEVAERIRKVLEEPTGIQTRGYWAAPLVLESETVARVKSESPLLPATRALLFTKGWADQRVIPVESIADPVLRARILAGQKEEH